MWSKEEMLGEGEKTVHISSRRRDDSTILDISGDVDFANSLEARQSLLDAIRESRPHRVLVNLSQVHYIDSSGVASLVEGLKASRDLGSRFILFGLGPSVREVFQLSRLSTVFEVYDNEEQALAA
jgi:anti-sigma B factor antagonist